MYKFRTSIAGWLGTVFAVSCGTLSTGGTDQRPNILIILTDDQGCGDVALHGNTDIVTDHMGKLARESVWLTAFTAQPVCAPSRACLMTGKHHLRTGVWGVHGGRDYLDLDVPTLADILAHEGYTTGFAGKWHLGKSPAYLPHRRGFEHAWTITDRLYQHTAPVINHSGVTHRPTGWTAEILTDYALEFMDARETEDADCPWMFYLAHPYIHEPYIAPPDRIQKHLDRGLSPSYAALCAMTEHLDSEVGRLIEGLDQRGLANETIVIYMGDNGPIGNPTNLPALTEAEMSRRNPLGLRGAKGNLYNNGVRVPAYFRWPGVWKPSANAATATIVDIVPTILEVVGSSQTEDLNFDGVSLLPVLNGKKDNTPDRDIVFANHEVHWPGRGGLYSFLNDKSVMKFEDQHLALRRGPYKLVRSWRPAELYNMIDDPAEERDLSAEMVEVTSQLQADLKAWWLDVHARPGSYCMPLFVLGGEQQGDRSTRLQGAAPTRVLGNLKTGGHSIDQWNEAGQGVAWAVKVESPGWYRFSIRGTEGDATGIFNVTAGAESIELPAVPGENDVMYVDQEISEISILLMHIENTGVAIERLWGLDMEPVDPPDSKSP